MYDIGKADQYRESAIDQLHDMEGAVPTYEQYNNIYQTILDLETEILVADREIYDNTNLNQRTDIFMDVLLTIRVEEESLTDTLIRKLIDLLDGNLSEEQQQALPEPELSYYEYDLENNMSDEKREALEELFRAFNRLTVPDR